MENTKMVSKIYISDEYYRSIMKKELNESKSIRELMDRIANIYDSCSDYNHKYEFYLKDGRIVCIDLANNVIAPQSTGYRVLPEQCAEVAKEKRAVLCENVILSGLMPSFIITKEVDFYYDFRREDTLAICVDGRRKEYGNLVIYTEEKECVSIEEYAVCKKKGVTVYVVQRLKEQNWSKLKFFKELLLKYQILPSNIDDGLLSTMSIFIELYAYGNRYFDIDDNLCVEFNINRIWGDMMEESERGEKLKKIATQLEYVVEEIIKKRVVTWEELLECEKVRADIEPYEMKILTDPNRGHWDLWSDEKNGKHYLEVDGEYVARNPVSDIKEEGVIAIDFGTKSTVVVYQGDIEHSLPMGIGDGNLSKGPSSKRYENPTIMQFVNIKEFLSNYNARKGRPETKWEDLTISHTALDKFQNCKSEEYYSYLYQLKQWAGQRGKQFRIKSVSDEVWTLPPFMELKDDDLNPIELYAYYIGLYINNMRHGIFLDYYLSFPVTYEKRIREKIIASFKKGLQKSLPEDVQNNSEIMSKFSVNGSISEPAAYAACALQEYGLDPDKDEEIFYGIFDFGGGTTDFDFGLWEKSNKRRYDYKIENFGAGGDEFLGGENLLQMLAFDIFKDNQDIMLKNGYTFTLAPKSKEFLGSDALLSSSQEAEKNMHNLMECLRPYWEQSDENIVQRDKEMIEHFTNLKEKISKLKVAQDQCIEDKDGSLVAQAKYEDGWDEKRVKEFSEAIKEFEDEYNDGELPIGCEYEYMLSKFVDFDESFNAKLSALNNINIKVLLYDKDGNAHPAEELTTTRCHIIKFIRDRIEEGIENFFNALILSYENDRVKKPTKINIFLAGNSSKSLLVKKLFNKKISQHTLAMKERIKKENLNENVEINDLFIVYPPLGTAEAREVMRQNNRGDVDNDFEKPTGKTGVAFGLIQLRNGGNIEYVSCDSEQNEIPFQYFLGHNSKKKFELFKDDNKQTKHKGKPDYNTWYNFIEADTDTFYMYYTSLPECVSGDLMVEGNPAVRRLKCQISVVNEDANVYIKAINPHAIQYAVSAGPDVDRDRLGEIYTKELE